MWRAAGSAGLARPPRGSASAALERAFPCSAEATRVGGGGCVLGAMLPFLDKVRTAARALSRSVGAFSRSVGALSRSS